MKFKVLSCLIIVFVVQHCTAQSFKWSAELEKTNLSGFYKISLTPDIISKTENLDLSDIRLFQNNAEISYLLRKVPDSTLAIPAPQIAAKEDKANQRSIIEITFKAPYQVNKLVVNLNGFRYYRRKAWLSEINPTTESKKRAYTDNSIENFVISSQKAAIIDLPGEKRYKKLFLVIENEDNAPLLIKNVNAYQKNTELITYLEKDKQYLIKIGHLNMPLPRYDLSYFNDSISNNVPLIGVLNFKVNKVEVPQKEAVLIKKSWLWIAIGSLILLLGGISYFIIKDMQSKKQQ